MDEIIVTVIDGSAGFVCQEDLLVTAVDPGTPSQFAGVAPGMKLSSFNGTPATAWSAVKGMAGATPKPWQFGFTAAGAQFVAAGPVPVAPVPTRVMEHPEAWQVVHETNVRCSESTNSKAEKEVLRPPQQIILLEEKSSDGHRRGRIGLNQWVSLVTASGKSLLTLVAPIRTHDVPCTAAVQINGKGEFSRATLQFVAPILTVVVGNGTTFRCSVTAGEVGDPKAARDGHLFAVNLRAKSNFTSTTSELSKAKKVLFSFHSQSWCRTSQFGF